MLQEWNGSAWIEQQSPVVAQYSWDLHGVSCVSVDFCMAVGYAQTTAPSTPTPFILMWNGSTWTLQTTPALAGQAQALTSVSCLSTTFCMAVGDGTSSGNEVPGSTEWNGSSWSAMNQSITASFGEFDGVSCGAVSFCMAVGVVSNGVNEVAVTESWNGTTWSAAPTTSGPPTVASQLDGVSCIGTTFCAAVGSGYDGNGADHSSFRNLTELWNGSSWSYTPSAVVGSGVGNLLYGVSCFAATSCSAVGTYYTDPSATNSQNEALVWNGQSWTAVTTADYPTANPNAALDGVSCLSNWACMAVGIADAAGNDFSWNIMSPIARSGYRFVASDGGVFNYGAGAPFLGSLGGTHLNAPVVGMAVMPAGDGYYLVAADGGVFNYGSAQFYGSMGGKPLNKPIVGMAVTPDGGGYWLVASDGGIFAFGDANFFGSAGALILNKPVVGMAPAPNGLGYWLVASDGGVFNYGSAAPLLGSMGGKPLNKPIVGIGATTSGQYYLVASDGGIFAFPGGAAGPPFYGSTGAIKLNKPIVGMTILQGGYYLSGSDGGIFAFPTGTGGLPFDGSTGGVHLNAPIVGVAN